MPQPTITYRNNATYQPYAPYIRLLFALLFSFIGTHVYAHISVELHILAGDKVSSPQQLVNKQNQITRAKSYDFFTLLDSTSFFVYGIAPPQPTARTICRRGFTGHEHLNIFGLIDMKGRMYDPQLGRFLSPDPYVQMPDYSQNFNRYSYCLNNPLKYTDPSGEWLNTIYGYDNMFFDLDDWFQSEAGNLIWQDKSDATIIVNGEAFTNIGKSVSILNIEGDYINYYENVPISISDTPIDAENKVLNNNALKG